MEEDERLNLLAIEYAKNQDYDGALEIFESLLKKDPKSQLYRHNVSEAMNQKTRGLFFEERFEEMEAIFLQGLERFPESVKLRINYGIFLFFMERFKEGFIYYRTRNPSLQCTFQGKHYDPYVLNKHLKGKTVYLMPEKGIGDDIFFLRFIGLLKKRDARILFCTNNKIKSILKRHDGIDRVISHEKEINERIDFPMLLGDLPYALGIDPKQELVPSLKLKPNKESLKSIQDLLSKIVKGPFIGITWRAGSSNHPGDFLKAIGLDQLAKVLKPLVKTHSFLSLQRHPDPKEHKQLEKYLGIRIYDFSQFNEDLEGMLALLDLIDEYVGVCNTNMHLRASLGKTCRVLVSYPWDWRWVSYRKRSFWYPNFTYYCQTPQGSWDGALASLSRDLSCKK